MTLTILTSVRSDGSMKSIQSDDYEKIDKSRSDFLSKNNIQPESTTLVRLKYEGDNYCRYSIIDDLARGDGIITESTIIADALVTSQPNHALLLPLADCVGAVIYDHTKNILMVSHLGRHNLEQFGGTQSIDFLQKHHNVTPQDLNVWLSPAAGKTNYPLFKFENRSLHEVAIEQLTKAGVLLNNIEVSPIDSSMDNNYYSHSQFLKGGQKEDERFSIVAIMTD